MSAPQSTVPRGRQPQISYVLDRLSAADVFGEANRYAVEKNVDFFKAARSPISYAAWLFRSHSIDAARLLEINELLPELDRSFHQKLLEIERQPFPGMVSGMVRCLVEQTAPCRGRVRIASLGSGALEVERQFIEISLDRLSEEQRLTIVGFDSSDDAHDMAEENAGSLTERGVEIVRVAELNGASLRSLEEASQAPVLIVLAKNDIFSLRQTFDKRTFSMIIAVLFLHHLPQHQQRTLIQQMRSLAEHVAVYDGYRTFIHRVVQSLVGWSHPVFMNAAVFSNLRFLRLGELREQHHEARIVTYTHGHYLALYDP